MRFTVLQEKIMKKVTDIKKTKKPKKPNSNRDKGVILYLEAWYLKVGIMQKSKTKKYFWKAECHNRQS